MTHAERATRYAEDVVAGRMLACRLVKLACQRHLDDLARQRAEGAPFCFDEAAANKVCRFIELMPHVKGRWASRQEATHLEDWQCFVVAVPFGWLHKETGFRRYRRAYIEIPRKNGKSHMTAALGLYMFAADEEFGAEVYSGAGTEKQAWEVFGPAHKMAKRTEAFRDHYGVEVNAKNLHIRETGSKFEPIIGKPGDGASPSFSITDEYHEHRTDEQYDTMVTGMGSREQPMAWVITTAGSNTAGPCYNLRSEVVDVLKGSVENNGLFGVIYTIDEDDDWTSEGALRKANPNMGVSVFEDHLLSQQRNAINNPRKQAIFKTKHLNVWVTAAAPYFDAEKWKQLADSGLSRDQFEDEPCWKGLDLAAKRDLASDITLFRREEDGEWHYYAFGRHYVPEERVHDPARRHYHGWAESGWLIATPGNITDYDAIEADILADAETHRVVQVGYDPWGAQQIAIHLENHGVVTVAVNQTTKFLSEPMKWVEALIVDGRIHHNGDPVLAWAVGNVTAQEDRNENVFPRKENNERKIDPAVALIIAMGRCIVGEGSSTSVYEERDPWVV